MENAIAYAQSLLNDQYESNLYCSAVEKQVKVPSANPKSSTVVAEIGGQFTVVLSQDDVREVDNFFSRFKKELAHPYAEYYFSLWNIHLKI
jgi:hypothetical protein